MKDFKRILGAYPKLKSLFKENKTEGSFTCRTSGSEIIFEGTDDMDKVHGSQQDISYFNEITETNESVYLQVKQRTNDVIFADYNPSKSFWFEKNRKSKDAVFIHSDYTKNSECPVGIIKDLNSYAPINETLFKTSQLSTIRSFNELEAKELYSYLINDLNLEYSVAKKTVIQWYNEKIGTANKYMHDVYCLGIKSEKPDKIYNGWTTISTDDYDSLPYIEYNGLDFGTARPTAMVGVKYDGARTIYVKPKLYKPAKTDSGIIKLITDLHESGELNKTQLIVADSAKQTYINLIRNKGFLIVGAQKGTDSVSGGIGIVQQLKIVYVPDKDFEEEYDTYSYILDRYNKATDVPIKKDDHYLDALRYIVTYLYYYLGIKL